MTDTPAARPPEDGTPDFETPLADDEVWQFREPGTPWSNVDLVIDAELARSAYLADAAEVRRVRLVPAAAPVLSATPEPRPALQAIIDGVRGMRIREHNAVPDDKKDGLDVLDDVLALLGLFAAAPSVPEARDLVRKMQDQYDELVTALHEVARERGLTDEQIGLAGDGHTADEYVRALFPLPEARGTKEVEAAVFKACNPHLELLSDAILRDSNPMTFARIRAALRPSSPPEPSNG